MKKLALILFFLTVGVLAAQEKGESNIEWLSFEEAVKRAEKEPRKIIVDVYTDWCGWCKKMDATTFTNPVIVKYIREKYYAVKVNAESQDTVRFNGNVFVYKPEFKANELALSLLSQKMTYPTTVYLDENFSMLTPIAGYILPPELEKVLKFFGENTYQTMKWEEFSKNFHGEAK